MILFCTAVKIWLRKPFPNSEAFRMSQLAGPEVSMAIPRVLSGDVSMVSTLALMVLYASFGSLAEFGIRPTAKCPKSAAWFWIE